MTSYLTGIVAVIGISLAWVAVQLAWRRTFPDESGDPDALAGRMGCHGCSCTDVCERGSAEGSDPAEEGMR